MAGAGAAAGAALGKSGAGKLISGLGGIGGLISIGSSVAGLLSGIGQKKKAKEAMAQAELLNPGVEGYQAIANEAQQAARQGMGSQEYNLASTGIQRGTSSALGAASRLSNPIAAISNINRNQNDAFAQLNASNEGIKRQNRAASWQAQSQLQQARQQQYADAYNQAQALMGAGQQNQASALGGLGQFGLYQSLYGNGANPTQQVQGSNPMSPAQMSMLSSYKTPSLTGVGTPTNLAGLGNTSGSMNFGSFRTPSQYSGFGFKK
jgi:hypothetical protein